MKTVLITGGSRGIGKAIVEELAGKAYNIVFSYNQSEEEAKNIKQKLEDMGANIEIYKLDLSKKEDIKGIVKFTIEKFGQIDILVNNAGISQMKLFIDITDEDWKNMMETNLSSAFYITREVIPYMIKQKEGSIINISSIWGMVGASCEVHYSVAKAGVIGMTKALAKEVAPSNIKVNCIAPGIIDTDMNNELSDEEIQEFEKEIPLKRSGKPEEVAKCVKMLIENEYITGQVISPNGGYVI